MTENKSKVILYHAYGLTDVYNQVLFSLLTLHYHLKGEFENIRVVVYTDNPKPFAHLLSAMPLSLEPLSQQMLQDYKGENNFVHRVKICVIQDCFRKYNSDILYLDSDTYFTNPPAQLLESIAPSTSIMNSDDYNLLEAHETYENMDWLQIRRAIRNYDYTVNGQQISIPLTTRMWNAGIIGLSRENSALLENVLDLTDQIYSNKRVFTAEQFAFSYYLQNKTTLLPSGDVIFHYWPDYIDRYWKSTYNYHFRRFFLAHGKKLVAEQAQLAYHFSLRHDQLCLPHMNLFHRVLKRLKLVIEVAKTGKLQKHL